MGADEVACPDCGGTGYVRAAATVHSRGWRERCERCDGEGQICTACGIGQKIRGQHGRYTCDCPPESMERPTALANSIELKALLDAADAADGAS